MCKLNKSVLLGLLAACIATSASAALIGIQPGFPTTIFNGGSTSYDAASNLFTVNSVPAVIRFSPLTPPRVVLPDNGVKSMTLSLQVDETGTFVGGVAGDDLVITGQVDEDGDGTPDYTGVLLAGDVVEFGYLDTGAPTDVYDFRIQVNGGSLAEFFNVKDIGLVLRSANSSFAGDFTVDFSGLANGLLGPIDAVCALEASVEGCVQIPEVPVPNDGDCQGRVIKMTVVYTGEGCEASSHSQTEKEAKCIGDAVDSQPVSILVTDKKGKKIWASQNGVSVGDTILIDSANAAETKKKGKAKGKKNRLSPHTKIKVFNAENELIHEVLFHTSCSQPLNVGDQFGAFRIQSMLTTEGGLAVEEDPAVEEDEVCITELPYVAGPHCNGKVTSLKLRYTGAGCAGSSHTQDTSKVTCTGGAASASPVRIVVTDKDGNKQYLDQAGVVLGDVVEATAANAGANDFSAETKVTVYNAAGEQIESVIFHTSCSQPLNLGDAFASMEIYGMATTEGTVVSQELPVEYTYTVKNNSAGYPLLNVSVIDDVYGEVPGSPIASIDAGETATLVLTVQVSAAVTNTATVTGFVGGILQCQTTATAAITEAVAPPAPVECESKIKATLLKYIGPDIADATIEIIADSFKGTPVVYIGLNLTNGLIISSPTENGFTIDGAAHDKRDLGAKIHISINGVQESIHTSCSVPYVKQAPAPLNEPKGAPSQNWFVVDFQEKE
ncbi:MAG: hypothetical protein DRP56_05660 [Planctomycetota bacterium]|nr:MAG: hypothetical protein DRP56_05660 [Planctomycetota bacterium]